MKILLFYIAKEFLLTLPLSFLIFSFIFLIGRFSQLIGVIGNGNGVLLRLLIYIFIFSLTYSLPIAILTATLIVTGRLSNDNELLAATASGIRMWRLFSLIFVINFLFSLSLLYFGNNISPLVKYRFKNTIHTIVEEKPQLLFKERTFIKGIHGYRFFIEQIDRKELKGVYIWQLREGKFPIITFAKSGRMIFKDRERRINLLLFNGVREEIVTTDLRGYRRSRFKEYQFSILFPQTIERGKRIREMTLRELRDEIEALRGIRAHVFLAEINERAALSFTPLVFVIIGIPLGVFVKKSSRSIGFGLSVLIIIAYYVMMMFFGAIGEEGIIPIVIAIWLPNGLLATTGIFLLKSK